MALEYKLALQEPAEPVEATARLVATSHFVRRADRIEAPDLFVSVRAPSAPSEEIIEDEFGFKPRVQIYFRLLDKEDTDAASSASSAHARRCSRWAAATPCCCSTATMSSCCANRVDCCSTTTNSSASGPRSGKRCSGCPTSSRASLTSIERSAQRLTTGLAGSTHSPGRRHSSPSLQRSPGMHLHASVPAVHVVYSSASTIIVHP